MLYRYRHILFLICASFIRAHDIMGLQYLFKFWPFLHSISGSYPTAGDDQHLPADNVSVFLLQGKKDPFLPFILIPACPRPPNRLTMLRSITIAILMNITVPATVDCRS